MKARTSSLRVAGSGAGCSGQGNRKKCQRSARDVSNLADLDRLFGRIRKEKGKLDVVFANAGIAKYAPFGKITEEFYDSIFNINVKGLFFTVQKALPLLPDGASIILNA
jgi:NAD(P)-dependent dehydrogenase (short-subunit alcohol dehydrogenase family)